MNAGRAAHVPAALELAVLMAATWLLFALVPLSNGDLGVSWDMLNHHVYLGWEAAAPRFDRDVLPASFQTYQFPYLYAPLYAAAINGWSGQQTGLLLATMDVLAMPPVWIVARTCVAGNTWSDVALRSLAVLLAFLSGVVLSLLDTTANDLLSAIPLLWAMAISFALWGKAADRRCVGFVIAAGLLAGVSVACKWSNGPMALLLPILWAWAPQGGWRARVALVIAGGAATLAGFMIAYGSWGWQLWTHFGNPFFPMFEPDFGAVRAALGWHR